MPFPHKNPARPHGAACRISRDCKSKTPIYLLALALPPTRWITPTRAIGSRYLCLKFKQHDVNLGTRAASHRGKATKTSFTLCGCPSRAKHGEDHTQASQEHSSLVDCMSRQVSDCSGYVRRTMEERRSQVRDIDSTANMAATALGDGIYKGRRWTVESRQTASKPAFQPTQSSQPHRPSLNHRASF